MSFDKSRTTERHDTMKLEKRTVRHGCTEGNNKINV